MSVWYKRLGVGVVLSLLCLVCVGGVFADVKVLSNRPPLPHQGRGMCGPTAVTYLLQMETGEYVNPAWVYSQRTIPFGMYVWRIEEVLDIEEELVVIDTQAEILTSLKTGHPVLVALPSGEAFRRRTLWTQGYDNTTLTSYHAVVIIGYNEEQEYWLFANWWGQQWSYDGYEVWYWDWPIFRSWVYVPVIRERSSYGCNNVWDKHTTRR